MQHIFKIAIIIMMSSGVTGIAYAGDKEDKGQHKGDGMSLEHKSEQGMEHGKAYAGTREKNEKEEKVKEEKDKDKDKETKDKKEKKSKKEK